MNTVLRSGSFKVRIYVDDHPPRHVHVVNADGEAKIELGGEGGPELVWAVGMNRNEIRKAFAVVVDNRDVLVGKWEEIHGG